MAVYKQHTIQAGESLQLIATQKLGDTSRWYEIAQLNHLIYPYIVATPKEKLASPEHLKTRGDKIYLPSENTLDALGTNNFGEINRMSGNDSVYDNTLGMDIKMDMDTPLHGIDDGIAWARGETNHVALDRVIGIDNLKQSISFRLLTRYGTLPFHPNYGTHLLDMIGEPLNDDRVELVKIEILRTIKTDSRVNNATITEFEVPDGNSFFCMVDITPLDEDQAFKLFLERAKQGMLQIG